ncbi:MAG: nucleotidyltransferase domain-containing protein [Bacteroidota bacterium]
MNSIRENKFGLTVRDMQTILNIFSKYREVKEVHIFGSRAKDTYRPGSDIDLAIMNKKVTDRTITQLQNDFEESSLPYTVDLVNYPLLKHPEFIDHIKRVGRVFLCKNNTI